MLKRVVAIFEARQKVRKSPEHWPEMATSANWKERTAWGQPVFTDTPVR